MAEGVDLDGPGDLLQPFSELRGYDLPPHMGITRRLFDWLARAEENPEFTEVARLTLCVGALVNAVQGLERMVVEMSRGVHGGK